MEIDYKAIGQRIKIARIKKGITQEAVADLIDITPAHMSNVETGKTKVSLPTLIEIANALSVSVDVLLCDNVLASQNIFKGELFIIFSIHLFLIWHSCRCRFQNSNVFYTIYILCSIKVL